MLDSTHHPTLRSWVASANAAGTDFPIQNLPYGRFRERRADALWRIGVAIGDQVLDLKAAAEQGRWDLAVLDLLAPLTRGDLNAHMALGREAWRELRLALSNALVEGSLQENRLQGCLLPQSRAEMGVPCHIGDYTDFYTGIHHATTVGKLFRPDNPLLPNYKWVPIGYHGRASSIVASGHAFHRPLGQTKGANEEEPRLAPSHRLDYELELGLLVGSGNALGSRIDMAQAEDHMFGLTLLNDWSARDVQAWEYQPLGPFLAKNFATSLSPWVVTMEALAPFRAPFVRVEGDPHPLRYLDTPANRTHGSINMTLEAWLQTAISREEGKPPVRLSSANYCSAAYWTFAQLVAHHTVNGCNLQAGDLLGSGTMSGPLPDQAGSLLELCEGGKAPIELPGGETRTFLQDGDTLILRGYCERAGARRIGLGECVGTVLPARLSAEAY